MCISVLYNTMYVFYFHLSQAVLLHDLYLLQDTHCTKVQRNKTNVMAKWEEQKDSNIQFKEVNR